MTKVVWIRSHPRIIPDRMDTPAHQRLWQEMESDLAEFLDAVLSREFEREEA